MVRVVGRVRLTHNKHGSDHGLTIFASGSKKSGFGSSQNFLIHFCHVSCGIVYNEAFWPMVHTTSAIC